MTEQKLIKRLNFEDDDVYLDGSKIFSVPHKTTESPINLLGISQSGKIIYIGSGNCCFGPINILVDSASEGNPINFKLDQVRIPDFNVYDIVPAVVNSKETGFGNSEAILTTGYGCAGAGVKLIGTYYPKSLEVVSEKDFKDMWDRASQTYVMPRIRIDEQNRTINLDLLMAGYRLKVGRSRAPKLPACLIDDSYEPYTVDSIHNSKDLTSILNNLGLDIEKTIEANIGYVRIRK